MVVVMDDPSRREPGGGGRRAAGRGRGARRRTSCSPAARRRSAPTSSPSRAGADWSARDGLVQRRALRAARRRAVELPDGRRRRCSARLDGPRPRGDADGGRARARRGRRRLRGARCASGSAATRAGTSAARARARTRTPPRCSPASRRSTSAAGSWSACRWPGMEPQVPRISLTLPALNAAREVVFLVTGADKARGGRARVRRRRPTRRSPAAHVRPRAGELLVFLDEAAAEELG